MSDRLPPLALTMGEPGGVGPELILKAWQHRARHKLPPFFVLADPDVMTATAAQAQIDTAVRLIATPAESLEADPRLPVLPLVESCRLTPGTAESRNGPAVIEAIDRGVKLVKDGAAAALVTSPIQKSSLYEAGFAHPGHTEYLGVLDGQKTPPVMLLAAKDLRVVPATVHVPLAQVSDSLTEDRLVAQVQTLALALQQDFGLGSPRIAMAGLNPHAGESGTIGREEIEVIVPAIKRLRADGYNIQGPFPADSLFHADARANHDAVVCMYHDQALIPLKTIDFWGGVNVTLGLSFIRTSPDHGTALAIAGHGKANPESLFNALHMAHRMARHRQAFQQATSQSVLHQQANPAPLS